MHAELLHSLPKFAEILHNNMDTAKTHTASENTCFITSHNFHPLFSFLSLNGVYTSSATSSFFSVENSTAYASKMHAIDSETAIFFQNMITACGRIYLDENLINGLPFFIYIVFKRLECVR